MSWGIKTTLKKRGTKNIFHDFKEAILERMYPTASQTIKTIMLHISSFTVTGILPETEV